jgi:hypothetical protein
VAAGLVVGVPPALLVAYFTLHTEFRTVTVLHC